MLYTNTKQGLKELVKATYFNGLKDQIITHTNMNAIPEITLSHGCHHVAEKQVMGREQGPKK